MSLQEAIRLRLFTAFMRSELTLEVLSQRTGLSTRQLRRVFRGESRDLQTAERIADVLRIRLALVDPADAVGGR